METQLEMTETPFTRDHLRLTTVDLVAASYRSSSFPQDWSREKREKEVARYEKFLLLAAKTKGRATPTREIDEFWHLHMLHPVAYSEDCRQIFGRIFDHDGGFGLGPGELPLLKAAFTAFAELWQTEYGEPYIAGVPKADNGQTSCWHNCQSRCWHACSD